MDKIIFELPVGIAVKFPCRNATNTNIWILFVAYFFAPFDTNLSREFCDVFVIFKICPKFNFGTWL